MASGPGGYILAMTGQRALNSEQADSYQKSVTAQLPQLQGRDRGKLAVLVADLRVLGDSGGVKPAQLAYQPQQGFALLTQELTAELAEARAVTGV